MVLTPSIIPNCHTLKTGITETKLTFKVSDSLPDLELHFPNDRLIAGYYQFIWLGFLVQKTFKNYFVSKIIDAKFKEKIIAGDEISIYLSWERFAENNKQTLDFKIESADLKVKSIGKIEIDFSK